MHGLIGRQGESLVGFLREAQYFLHQADRRRKARSLNDHLGGQVAGQDFGKARHVVDVFFGIEGGQLAAEFGQAVNDLGLHLAHSGIECAEQTDRAAADNGHIV